MNSRFFHPFSLSSKHELLVSIFFGVKFSRRIRDEITGEVRTDGTTIKPLTKKDQESLDEAHEINKKILLASGAKPETITRGVYESGHPCCTAPIGKVVDENQETKINNLF